MTTLRRTLFYFLLIIYLILTPWLILRMLGYAWHPLSGRCVKTGLIILNTSPSGATVFVDGKRQKHLTPLTIGQLIPGKNFVRIEKEGYHDWASHIQVESNTVTQLPLIELKTLDHL